VKDEAARRHIKAQAQHAPAAPGDGAGGEGVRALVELTREQALALLGSVGFGRIVFTRGALPAIRPVNHALIDGRLVIRTHEGAALTSAAGGGGVVVAYEADAIDPDTHLGWSVVVTGFARLVTDPTALARYEQLLTPWIAERMEHAVAIQLDQVDGYWMTSTGRSPGLDQSSTSPT
jgi:hypothetical protein